MHSDYDKKTLENIMSKCEHGRWYDIDPNRSDYKELIESMKRIIDSNGVITFFDTRFTKFKRIDMVDEGYEKFQPKTEDASYGDFYTKAYDKNTLSERLRSDSVRPRRVIPGTDRPISEISKKILELEEEQKKIQGEIHKKQMENIGRLEEWKNM